MKLVSFNHDSRPAFGIWKESGVIDLDKRFPDNRLGIRGILDRLSEVETFLDCAADFGHDEITLLPPVPDPGKILCVGLNYKSHIAETGRETPQHPVLFPRYASSIVGDQEDLIKPSVSSMFDFEGELAFVIGKGGRHIKLDQALQHVAGYSCFNDGSIRDWQRHTTQFLPGKCFWRSGSFGPWLVTTDEVGKVSDLNLTTQLNGTVMQQACLDDLVFGVPELIAYISTIMPLEPGDVVATGTTGGVGLFRTPPLFMKSGDRVTVSIDKIGILSNSVIDED